MSAKVLFVSVARSFDSSFTLAQLEPWVSSAWATTVAKAEACDRIIAVADNQPVGAWRVRGAYPTDESFRLSNGDERPRVGLSLGDPLPILPEYLDVPLMRRGVRDIELDVDPLTSER